VDRSKIIIGGPLDNMMFDDIDKYLEKNPNQPYAIDIGCSNNSYLLPLTSYQRILIDYDMQKLKNIPPVDSNCKIVKTMINVSTVNRVLEKFTFPSNISFLNIDIDGVDLFVMDEILKVYKPYLICTEINEKIPPPIKFSVKPIENFVMDGSTPNHFYGYSIMCLSDIIEKYGYDLVKLEWNNCFLIKKELNTFGSVAIEDAYNTGYASRQGRTQIFYYNSDMQYLLDNHSVDEKLNFINNTFKKYDGTFILETGKIL
jgi:hypothetical protein